MKKLISEEYRIPGTSCYNWSKYSRENIPKPAPKFKVGDEVRLTIDSDIIRVGQDCDGTPLYELRNLGFGFSDNDLELIEEGK